MAATEGKRATVPSSTHEEDRCFEQERFGSRGKIPLLEICNILSRRTKHSPQFLCRKKCREAICSAPQLLSGLCRTQFATLNRKLRPESTFGFEASHQQIASTDSWHASSSLHKQKLHHMCTALSCSSRVQHQKGRSLFFKMLAPVTVKSLRNVPSQRAENISDRADLLSLV